MAMGLASSPLFSAPILLKRQLNHHHPHLFSTFASPQLPFSNTQSLLSPVFLMRPVWFFSSETKSIFILIRTNGGTWVLVLLHTVLKKKIRIPRVKAITAGPLTNDGCILIPVKEYTTILCYMRKDGVYDVTKRYSRKWHEVLSRRNITTEPILSIILSNIRRECRQNFASQVISALEDQDRNEAEVLQRELHSKDDASISLPGRQSGNKEWRMSRSEFGSDEICFPSSSCCPARKCIDEHVTKIYNAFCPIISQSVEKSCSKSRAVEVLLFFKQMLINLKNSPFRTRRTSINPVSNGAQHLFLQMLPSFDQFFDALSLKSELDASGRVDIYLAADPVRTSIALPVLFHALDDVIHNVNMCNNFNKNSLSWPLQKLNKIYSGLVLTSGEELPFGIVTSAFDGTRMSKWEEPNGPRGEGCLSHQEGTCSIFCSVIPHKVG